MAAQSGGMIEFIRMFCGSASAYIVSLGGGSRMTATQSVFASAEDGIGLLSAGSAAAVQLSQIVACEYGASALIGALYMGEDSRNRIMDCNYGIEYDDTACQIYQPANFSGIGTSNLKLTNNTTARYWTDTVFDGRGAGSPEGVVTARIGSTWRRTDGGAGTSFYVKESGTGNTGWVGK